MSQEEMKPLDYDALKRKVWNMNSQVVAMEQTIATSGKSMERRELLERNIKKVEDHVRVLKAMRNKNKNLHLLTQRIYKEYRNRKMEVVSDYITDSIALFFPDRPFRAKVTFEESRGKLNPSLKLYDSRGFERRMNMTEGQFFQSIVNNTGSISMLLELGLTKLYLDESFAVSDQDNMKTVSLMFKELLGPLVQIFMIEQTSIGYRNLPRRELHLSFDSVNEVVDSVVYRDYNEEDLIDVEGGDVESGRKQIAATTQE